MPPAGFVVATRASGVRVKDGAPGVTDGDETTAVLRVDRRMLVAVLKRRAQRARRFRTLPITAAFLCIYIWAMVSRAGLVSDAYPFEKRCAAPRRRRSTSGHCRSARTRARRAARAPRRAPSLTPAPAASS